MKCEICHKAEARLAVTTKVDGVEKELYVCGECARKINSKPESRERSDRNDREIPRDGNPEITVVGAEGKEPPPFVEEFVKATLGFMKDVAEEEEKGNRRCPACKRKWDEISKDQRLGCPRCWKTFASQLRANVLYAQYGRTHVGAAPSVDSLPDPKESRIVLERELKQAIEREDYHRAAELKRRLDEINGGESSR